MEFRARGVLVFYMVLQGPLVLELFLTVATPQRGFCMSRPHVKLQRFLTNSFRTNGLYNTMSNTSTPRA